MVALDCGGARLTVSEESSPMNAVRPAAGARRFRAAAPALLIVFSLILVFVGERLAPGFATVANMLQLAKLASFLGLAAMGQTIVMLTGGIDLSIAWVLTASAVVFTGVCDGQDANVALAAAAAISVGLVTGFLNGFGIVKLRISPIVMTLAMNNIMLGRDAHLYRRHAERLVEPAGARPRHRQHRLHPGDGHPLVPPRDRRDHGHPLYEAAACCLGRILASAIRHRTSS